MAERPNAGALKAPEGKLSGGSNPSLAATPQPTFPGPGKVGQNGTNSRHFCPTYPFRWFKPPPRAQPPCGFWKLLIGKYWIFKLGKSAFFALAGTVFDVLSQFLGKSAGVVTLENVLYLVLLVVIDIVVVAGISIGVGAWAPRWSGAWLTRDFGPLHFAPWESPKFFRALKTRKLAERLPELGSAFGGKAKSELPGRDAAQIDLYLIELRRAEWVHWVSLFSWVPLAFFNPWYLTLLFMVIQISGNTSFFLILRANRLRLVQIRQRLV